MQRGCDDSPVIPRLRPSGSGRALPGHLGRALQAIFGTGLADVRIHVGPEASRIDARAFAVGHDLYFAPGQYDPETRDGVRLLGHELAHVIQQRSGRVRATAGFAVVHDPVLEAEADLIGHCLAAAVEDGRMPERPVYAPESARSPGAARTIQCLMEVEAFKTASNAPGLRNKIAAVDSALTEYHRLTKTVPKDWVALLAKIRALYQACQTYGKERPNSNRQAGVDKLVREIAVEETVLVSLAGFQQAASLDEKWEHLEAAQERFLTFKGRAEFSSRMVFSEDLQKLLKDVTDEMKTAANGTGAILRDLEELKRIGAEPTTPDIIRAVIQEGTAAQNLQQLDFSYRNPAAVYNTSRGMQRKYTLHHSLAQTSGKKFRLGSLLHELTHVSIAETFGNTVIMLAIGPEASDDEMMALVNVRKANIMNLQSMVEEAPLLEPGDPPKGQGLTAEQKKEFKDKAGYATSPQIGTYLEKLQNFPKAKLAPQQRQAEALDMHARLMGLLKKGMKSELVEYDTVINQMMLWSHLWRLDFKHPVYEKLRTLALIAYNHRGAYRQRKKRIVSPMNLRSPERTPGRRMSIG